LGLPVASANLADVQLSMFRRKSEVPAAPEETVTPGTGAHPRAYTVSKREQGMTTPKRVQGGRRVEAPPANRREAVARMRQKDREDREQRRAGLVAGKEEYLPARDKGPERALVRDVVDSRRNLATYFLPGAIIVIFASAGTMPKQIQLAANLFWVVLALAVIIDSVLLCLRVKRLVLRRFPKATQQPRSHYFYAVMRAFQFRKLRLPAPKVKIGEAIQA
jgi:hypothetical protein